LFKNGVGWTLPPPPPHGHPIPLRLRHHVPYVLYHRYYLINVTNLYYVTVTTPRTRAIPTEMDGLD